ncbi:MAG: hypothetical protein RDU25_05695 [Patescibacteria group bacterium]|nr:hypothetical protein [Patescibacteria group bacterium]
MAVETESRFDSLYPGVDPEEYPGQDPIDWSSEAETDRFLACEDELEFLRTSAASFASHDEVALLIFLAPEEPN